MRSHNFSRSLNQIAIAMIAFVVHVPGVSAQLEEVTVTAQRRAENIQEVPVAVTSFSADELEASNTLSVTGLADATPNLQITGGAVGNGSGFVIIRGVGQLTNQAFFDAGVGTYVDGIYRPSVWGGLFDLLNVERVEVLRGPQGDLYGKNAIGGAVNVISKQPDPSEMFGSITLAGGNYDRVEARGFVNVPIVQDVLGVQVSAGSRKADGHIKTPTGRLSSQDNTAYRIAAKWVLSDRVEWTASVDRTDLESSGPPFYHRDILATSALNTAYNNLVGTGTLGNVPLISDAFVTGDPFRSNITDDAHRTNSEETTFSNRITVDFANAELISLTSFKELDANHGFDADGTPLSIAANNNYIDGKSFSQEFQLSGSAMNSKLEYLVGVYYLNDKVSKDDFAENDIYGWPYVGVIAGVRDRSSDVFFDQELDSFSVFGRVSYHFTDALSASLGLRYMTEDKSVVSSRVNASRTAPVTRSATASDDWSNVSPKIQLKYQLNDDVLIYGSAASGFKSGGINNTILADANGNNVLVPFDEEQLWSYEVGLKADWAGGTVRTNVALFMSDYEDLQTIFTDFVPTTGTQVRTVINAGQADLSGLELEAIWAASDNVTVKGSAAYLKAEYGVNLIDATGSTIFVKGDPLALAPEFSYSLTGIYDKPLSGDRSLSFRADYSWRDDQHFQSTGTLAARSGRVQDAYGLLNLSVTYHGGENWRASAYGTNVTDEVYTTNKFVQTGFVGVRWDMMARPAEYGLKFAYDF